MYDNILIVDDSSTSRMITQKCFTIVGFDKSTYYEAENGIDAIAMLREKNVDLIVTDLNMPKMDGFTFIKTITDSEKYNNVKFIIISSLAIELTKEELNKFNIVAIIKKPISPAKIKEVISND